jgi:hypothetical protein
VQLSQKQKLERERGKKEEEKEKKKGPPNQKVLPCLDPWEILL